MKKTTWFKIANVHTIATLLSAPIGAIFGLIVLICGYADHAEAAVVMTLLFGIGNAAIALYAIHRSA